MAIALRDVTQVFGTTASTSVTIPVSTQAGDVIILQAVGGFAPTTLNGWDQLYAASGTMISGYVATKIAQAGDAGASITVNWSNAYNHVINVIVLSGAVGVKFAQSSLRATSGGTGTPATLSAKANDMMIYMGGNRNDGGAPSISRGTTALSGADGSLIAGGVIGYELLTADVPSLSCTFTSPTNGNGYVYSVLMATEAAITQISRQSQEVLVIDSVTNTQVSRQSVEMMVNDTTTNTLISRQSLEIMLPVHPRYRGWGVKT